LCKKPLEVRMKEKVVRIRIPEILMKQYKMICIERDLSIPKQNAQLIKAFIQSYEPTKRSYSQTTISLINTSAETKS